MHPAVLAVVMLVGAFFLACGIFGRFLFALASRGLARFGIKLGGVGLALLVVAVGTVLTGLAVYRAQTATLRTVESYNALALLGVLVVLSSLVSAVLLGQQPKRRRRKRGAPSPLLQQLATLGLMLAVAGLHGLIAWLVLGAP